MIALRLLRALLLALLVALLGVGVAAVAPALPASSGPPGEALRFATPTPVAETALPVTEGPPPVCRVGRTARGPRVELPPAFDAPCVGGAAAGFACRNVDLAAFLPLDLLGAGQSDTGSSLWGWTDAASGREFALMGLANGTAFVEISNATAPVVLGLLPSHTGVSIWREMKVYADHAFVVSDLNGYHGIQVFDLRQLLSVTNPPVTFAETAHYDGVGSVHNMVINPESGFGYAVGTSLGGQQCNGGLHMIDLRDPRNPTFAGCFSDEGYTHDAQCVIYRGPDADYQGREICIASNAVGADSLAVVDVTDKGAPQLVAKTSYPGAVYTHQSWLTEDQRYMLLDDEFDEDDDQPFPRTHLWDMQDLDNPRYLGFHQGETPSVDHNQYVRGGLVYQANYQSGLRVLDLAAIGSGTLQEIAWFDTYPQSRPLDTDGAWNVYPYFPSGNVIVSGITEGLFVLQPRWRAYLPLVHD